MFVVRKQVHDLLLRNGWEAGGEIDVQEKRAEGVMKGTVDVISGICAIINAERFSFLKRILRVTAYVLRFCTKLFERLREKVDESVIIEDVIQETCLTVDELVDAESCWVKFEQTLMSGESQKFEKLNGSLNLFHNKGELFRSRTRTDTCLKLNL